MTEADFRRIALSFEGAEEGSHMGAADFRVGGRIFATLASVKEGFGNLMLTPEFTVRRMRRLEPREKGRARATTIACSARMPWACSSILPHSATAPPTRSRVAADAVRGVGAYHA